MRNLDKFTINDRNHDKIFAGLRLSNLEVELISKPVVKLVKVEGTMYATLYIEHASIKTDYLVYYLLVKGTGKLQIQTNNMKLAFSMSLGRNDDDMPYLNLINCDGEGDWMMDFQGQFGQLLNLAVKPFPSLRNYEAFTDMCTVLSQTIYEKINPIIEEKLQPKVALNEYCVDVSLQRKPSIFSDAIEFTHEGIFTQSCEKNVVSVGENIAQIVATNHHDSEKMLYAYITELSINSFFDNIYQSDKLHYRITKDNIPSQFENYITIVKSIIPDLSGADPEIDVKLIESPKIHFVDDASFMELSFQTELSFVGINKSNHIVTLNQTVSLEFEFEYTNSMVHFNIKHMDSHIAIVLNSHEELTETWKSLANSVLPLVKLLANQNGERGIEVPIANFADIAHWKDLTITRGTNKENLFILSTDFDLQFDNLMKIFS